MCECPAADWSLPSKTRHILRPTAVALLILLPTLNVQGSGDYDAVDIQALHDPTMINHQSFSGSGR